jgi:hypothetical protein
VRLRGGLDRDQEPVGLTATEGEWNALREMLDTCNEPPQVEVTRPETSPPTPAGGPDRDCGDFDTWQEAQAFYEAAGGPEKDPHRLDRDEDGIACESLPGAP